ncbi:kinesin light chain [Ceratobasidium sp. AG-Ba]|nr:kinesin light chain [Ceratobasidium sp. AG-Ba]QRW13782.1 kinesin light chain [Ceratobasidium sp. AG-Ba]
MPFTQEAKDIQMDWDFILKELNPDDVYTVDSLHLSHGLDDTNYVQNPSETQQLTTLPPTFNVEQDQAERLFSEVLSASQRAFGNEHEGTLITMSCLASTYRKQGKFDRAESLYLQVVPMRKRVLGEDHDHTLTSMHNLALTYKQQGRLDEAEQLFSDVLSTSQRVFGNEHEETLTTMNCLASIYRNQERFDKAEHLYLQLVSMTRRVLGGEHYDTLISMHNLAVTYQKQGRLDEAEKLFSDVLSTRQWVFGNKHKETLITMSCLASLYQDQERFDRAEHLYLQVVPMRKRVLSGEHHDTLISMHNLAVTYKKQGRLDEAEQLFSDVISTRQRIFGNEHVETLNTMNCLASTYRDQERFDKAEHLYLQVVPMRKRVLGEEHDHTLISMHDLALTYQKQGRLDEAEQLYSDVLLTRQRVFGNEHRGTLDTVAHLTDTYLALGKPNKIVDLKMRAMQRYIGSNGVLESTSSHNLSIEKGINLESRKSSLMNYENEDSLKARSPGVACPSFAVSFVELWEHGCTDLTWQLDLARFPDHPLAGGRFGDVWCGRLKSQAPIAVKTLRLHTLASDPAKNIKRVVREIYTWSQLQHKNVLPLLGIAMFQDQIAMVSPWMENGTLMDYIQRHPSVEPWGLVTMTAGIIIALILVSQVHGDIKGNNFLVSAEGVVKLSDFGNSVLAAYSLALSSTNTVGGGTYRWMAPELIKREDAEAADRSKPADMYAVGMVRYLQDMEQ